MFTFVNYQGVTNSTIKVTDIVLIQDTKSALIKIYGSDANIVQKMGKNNRVFTVEGFVTGSTQVDYLNNALNYTGSIYYSSSSLRMEMIGTAAAGVKTYFKNLVWQDDGKNPMIRQFSLDLVEIIL